jgi:hypothetical protein
LSLFNDFATYNSLFCIIEMKQVIWYMAQVEFEEVRIKIPKPLVDFCRRLLEFTKEETTTLEESFSRIVVQELKSMVDNEDIAETFPSLQGQNLVQAYRLDIAFERALSIIPVE